MLYNTLLFHLYSLYGKYASLFHYIYVFSLWLPVRVGFLFFFFTQSIRSTFLVWAALITVTVADTLKVVTALPADAFILFPGRLWSCSNLSLTIIFLCSSEANVSLCPRVVSSFPGCPRGAITYPLPRSHSASRESAAPPCACITSAGLPVPR